MTHVLAIDIETTGPGVHSHRMIAFGASIVEVSARKEIDSFRALLPLGDHTNGRPAGWDERTYREFWMNSEKRADGQTPLAAIGALYADAGELDEATAARNFVAWTRAANARIEAVGGKLVVITDTVSFDTTFINAALDRHTDVPNLIELFGKYRPVRDVSSFYFGVARKTPAQGLWGSWNAAVDALALERATLPADASHDHDPMHDARYIALCAAHVYAALDEQHAAAVLDASAKKQRV